MKIARPVRRGAVGKGPDLGYLADGLPCGYSPIEPPAEVTAAMSRYLDLFGLSFGAFNFGITGDGQRLAYECNPGAQWLWLERQTNIGISAALAELLTAGTVE